MRFNQAFADGTLADYIDYLRSIRDRLPTSVFDFAADPRHHTLDGPETLHDSRLERIEICQHSVGVGLVTYEGRVCQLLFAGVDRYAISIDGRQGSPDLISWEIGLEPGGETMTFHAEFSSEPGEVDVAFSELTIAWTEPEPSQL